MDDGLFYWDDDDELMSLLGSLRPSPAASRGSAFEAYQKQRRAGGGATSSSGYWSAATAQQNSSGGRAVNVHRRMHWYLRRSTDIVDAAASETAAAPAWRAPQVERGSQFRHIMRERLRRERLSQGYADLQACLPHGRATCRGAKNNVVDAAVGYIRELEGKKRRLSARSEELVQAMAAARSSGGARGGGQMVVKVRAESGCSSSMVHVFEVVLRRLRAMEAELRVTAIQSCFRAGVLCMDVGVESKISSCEVDMAVTNATMELQGIKGSSWSFCCQTVAVSGAHDRVRSSDLSLSKHGTI